jgi:hypothetical protein
LEEDDDQKATTNRRALAEMGRGICRMVAEQCENDIGGTPWNDWNMRKLVVIRRLLNVDLILVVVGDPPKNKRKAAADAVGCSSNYVVS